MVRLHSISVIFSFVLLAFFLFGQMLAALWELACFLARFGRPRRA